MLALTRSAGQGGRSARRVQDIERVEEDQGANTARRPAQAAPKSGLAKHWRLSLSRDIGVAIQPSTGTGKRRCSWTTLSTMPSRVAGHAANRQNSEKAKRTGEASRSARPGWRSDPAELRCLPAHNAGSRRPAATEDFRRFRDSVERGPREMPPSARTAATE
jgi:hypothetical protein